MQVPATVVPGLVCLLLALPACATGETPAERLRAEHAAWQAASDDYRRRTAAGDLGRDEAESYRAWLDSLRARVDEGCRGFAARGETPPEGVACTVPGSGEPVSAPIADGAAPTRVEQAESLDRQLGRGLGEFDEMLLREQARVRAAAPRDAAAAGGSTGSGSGSGDGSDGGATGGDATAAGGTPGTTATGGATAGGRAGAGQPGSGPVAGGGTTGEGGLGAGGQPGAAGSGRPADIPDGSDDDVVARQLREAAEQETDPELKARLWDEYRKYKQGTR